MAGVYTYIDAYKCVYTFHANRNVYSNTNSIPSENRVRPITRVLPFFLNDDEIDNVSPFIDRKNRSQQSCLFQR